MSSEYNYDADAQFFPFFVLTITSLITLPLTYSLLRSPSDVSASSSTTSKREHIPTAFTPSNGDIIDTQRAKQKRKQLRMKRMLTAGAGWLLMAYMLFLTLTTERNTIGPWDPFSVLDVSMSASEKDINRRYRRLSITMHPDKRVPNPALNETAETVNDEWVNIVKAYKTLTDEDVRNNWVMYGHPDGKQSTSFGIALPQLLVAEGSGKFVLLFYGALLAIGLPLLVGRWWYGMQKQTKEKVLVTSAGSMFREFHERMDVGDVLAAISCADEFKEILGGAQADAGLGKLEKKLLAQEGATVGMLPKDIKKLQSIEEPARRKTLALLWAYLARLDLGDKTLEAEKYELAPTALRLNDAFLSIALAYGFTTPVLSAFSLAQGLAQAIPPSAAHLPLLQLPHFTPTAIKTMETSLGKKDHLTIQSFLSLPAEQRRSIVTAAGLTTSNLSAADTLAKQLPLLKVEKAFFKVQNEKFILPSSLVQFVIKARVIPPGTTAPPVKDSDLLDKDPKEGDIAAQKLEPEQHPPPFTHAPYLPVDRAPRWHVFLADHRQGKIAVPPFTFAAFDKPTYKESEDSKLEPTFEMLTMKMQFQAPPQPGEYKFQMHLVCDSYVGFDYKQEAVMVVSDPATVPVDDVEEDDISEPEEDSIAGVLATAQGKPTADPNAPPKVKRERKKIVDEESDYESGTDEDEESESETDTDTDSDEE